MNPIRIPISLSPHIVDDKPRGYYLLAQRLFPSGAPILRRDQFVGFNGRLIVTVSRQNNWNSLLKMGIFARELEGQAITWLDRCKLYTMTMGFRMYIPGTVLRPTSADSKKVEMTGVFRKHEFMPGTEPLFYLELQGVTAEVLLGKKVLNGTKI